MDKSQRVEEAMSSEFACWILWISSVGSEKNKKLSEISLAKG